MSLRRWLRLALLLALVAPGLFGGVRFRLLEGSRRWPLWGKGRRASSVSAPHAPAAYAPVAPPAEEALEDKTASRKSRRRRLWGAASWAVYIGIIVLAIVFTPYILSRALDTQYPMAAVTSSSMWPTLKKGDLIFLKGVDKPEDLKVGDIIGFELDDGGFAIHRIVDIDGDAITTKGDANSEADPSISFDRVIGRMPKIGGRLVKVPYLGNLGILLGPLFGSETSDGGTLGEPVFEGQQSEEHAPPSLGQENGVNPADGDFHTTD
jgi:signal peptidase I